MEKENIHTGHRDRLREKYLKNGIEALEKHEILELMLFSVMPQGNTNHTGHYLMKSVGSLRGVFTADREELLKVKGVGEAAADLFEFQKDMFGVYSECRKKSNISNFTQKNGMQFIKNLFSQTPDRSCFYMILLGGENRMISIDMIAEGEFSYDDISVREIISKAVRLGAFRVVFAHNHVNGNVMPSDADIQFTKNINNAFSYVDIEMNDHIVVAGNTAVSIRNDMRVLD